MRTRNAGCQQYDVLRRPTLVISPVARGGDSSTLYSLSVVVNTLGHCQEINCNSHMAMPQSHLSHTGTQGKDCRQNVSAGCQGKHED